jgi:hypothetical protein
MEPVKTNYEKGDATLHPLEAKVPPKLLHPEISFSQEGPYTRSYANETDQAVGRKADQTRQTNRL